MSLSVTIEIKFMNHKTKTIAGLHVTKGMDFIDYIELARYRKEFAEKHQDIYTDKKLRSVIIKWNYSYTRGAMEGINQIRMESGIINSKSIGHAMLDVNNLFNSVFWQAVRP